MAGKTDYPVSLTIKAVDKATAPIRAITVRLHQLTAPIKAMSERFGKLGSALQGLSSVSGLTGVARGFAGVGGAVKKVGSEAFALGAKLFALTGVAGFALWSIVKGAVDAGDKLGEMADRVGLSVDAYASLQHAAAQADVEQEAFNTAMDKFNKNMGEMTAGKGGAFLKFLNEVSPTLAKQMKSAKGTEAALALMTDAFAKIDDPAKSAALAAAAFGKSGLQMGRFLHQGSAAIQQQQRRYMELTGSQEAFAMGAGVLDNQMRETELAFTGLRNVAAGALFPALTKLASAVTDFLVKNRDGIRRWATETGAAIQRWVDGGGIQRLSTSLLKFIDTAAWVLDKIGGLTGAFVAIAAAMSGPLLAAIGSAIPAIYSLGTALLTTPVGWFLLAVAAIAGSAWLIYENWDGITAHFKGWFSEIAAYANLLVDLERAFLTLDFGAVVSTWDRALEAYKRTLLSTLEIMKWIPGVGMILSRGFTAAGGESLLGPATGATAAAAPISSGPQSTEARVSVDFSNLPRGARVSTEPNSSQPVDLSLGYSMAAP